MIHENRWTLPRYVTFEAEADPETRLGSLRQRSELVPRRQIFVRSQQPWVNDLNSIPKFDGMPPR